MGTAPTTTPNFFQRLASETPAFWKRVQIFCLLLLALIEYLGNKNIVPGNVALLIEGFFAAGAFFAQLTVNNPTALQHAIDDPLSIISSLPDIITAAIQTQQAFKNPPQVDLKTAVDQYKADVAQPAVAIVVKQEIDGSTTAATGIAGTDGQIADINNPNSLT